MLPYLWDYRVNVARELYGLLLPRLKKKKKKNSLRLCVPHKQTAQQIKLYSSLSNDETATTNTFEFEKILNLKHIFSTFFKPQNLFLITSLETSLHVTSTLLHFFPQNVHNMYTNIHKVIHFMLFFFLMKVTLFYFYGHLVIIKGLSKVVGNGLLIFLMPW